VGTAVPDQAVIKSHANCIDRFEQRVAHCSVALPIDDIRRPVRDQLLARSRESLRVVQPAARGADHFLAGRHPVREERL
jgi:hypothetical protein